MDAADLPERLEKLAFRTGERSSADAATIAAGARQITNLSEGVKSFMRALDAMTAERDGYATLTEEVSADWRRALDERDALAQQIAAVRAWNKRPNGTSMYPYLDAILASPVTCSGDANGQGHEFVANGNADPVCRWCKVSAVTPESETT